MRCLPRVALFTLVTLFLLIVSSDGFVAGVPSKRTARRTTIKASLKVNVVKRSHAAVALTAAAAAQAAIVAPATATVGNMIAKALGYVIAIGSLAVYLPIVISLLQKKSADGFSVATWVFNLMGITLAVIYPLKKGFPLSTFVELVIMVVQSTGILGNSLHTAEPQRYIFVTYLFLCLFLFSLFLFMKHFT